MPSDAVRAYLCLGSNVGDRRQAMADALALLEQEGIAITACSSLYETPPWGPVPQGPYLNQVVEVSSPLGPHALLALALDVERRLGRDRAKETRFGPRRIDIDILYMDGLTVSDEDLEIPHPRILERAFVLVPLNEIAPDLEISGMRVGTALEGLDTSGIVKVTA